MKNNNYIHDTPYLRNSIAYDHDFRYTLCKMMRFFSFYFHFFIFWLFSMLGGKRAKNRPKFCLLGAIHHMSSFVVHKCKIIISPGVFFIFLKFWFFGLGGSRGKKWPTMTTVSFVTLYLRNHKSYDLDSSCTCVKA